MLGATQRAWQNAEHGGSKRGTCLQCLQGQAATAQRTASRVHRLHGAAAGAAALYPVLLAQVVAAAVGLAAKAETTAQTAQ